MTEYAAGLGPVPRDQGELGFSDRAAEGKPTARGNEEKEGDSAAGGGVQPCEPHQLLLIRGGVSVEL